MTLEGGEQNILKRKDICGEKTKTLKGRQNYIEHRKAYRGWGGEGKGKQMTWQWNDNEMTMKLQWKDNEMTITFIRYDEIIDT